MTEEEYRNAVTHIALCARLLSQHDLQDILEAIEHADSFGCFVDPTLWIKNRQKMLEDKEIIQAAMPLWRLADRLKQIYLPMQVSD